MDFKDHFSGHSSQYSEFRPSYPEHLFSWLASLCTGHQLAWDCATGSGQAAIGLSAHFDRIIATDASANQLAHAVDSEKISYQAAPAENSGIAADSVDLITVAQALHWFDIPAFAAEADRVLKESGVLAVWTYGLLTFDAGLNETIERLYADIVGEYWPFERKMVEGGYADVTMPFEPVPISPMEMTQVWNLAELLGYLNTWSAVKAYEKAHDQNPLELVYDDLVRHWGAAEDTKVATWPLIVRAWRKS